MKCEQVQEVLSADLDGEAEVDEVAKAMGHLLSCPSCRVARAEMVQIAELVASQPRPVAPDLAPGVVAETRAWTRARRGGARLALGVLGVFLGFESLPDLLAASHDAHLEHHLAVWGFTLATTFVLIALRPRAARMVRSVLTLFAVAMVAVAALDIARGETPMLAEVHHLFEVLGVGLVWIVSAPARRPRRPVDHALRIVGRDANQREVG